MKKTAGLMLTTCTDPYWNLAREEWLLGRLEEIPQILYLWQNDQTVVIGRNQNAYKECEVCLLEKEGGHLARRLSGGGAVYHDLGNLNFTFLARPKNYSVSRQMEILQNALCCLGLSCERSGRNDLTVNGRKVSGNAFYQTQTGCFHHGTILVSVDMERMRQVLRPSAAKLRAKGVDSVRSRVVNLCELDPSITVKRVKEALIAAYQKEMGPLQRLQEETSKELAALAEKYQSSKWRLNKADHSTIRLQQRFDWGEIELGFQLAQGKIQHCCLHSDAMELEFLEQLPACLQGCSFEDEVLVQAIQDLGTANPIEEKMKQDLIQLLQGEQDGERI